MKDKLSAPVVLFVLLLLPALLWNLGRECIIEDEAIRGLVAQEMMLSGDYIAPTLNGQYYYKKPPVYNWFIAASFALHSSASEWSLRLPNIIFLLLFAWSIYKVGRRYINNHVGLLSAAALITNGRILFYDSMKGLIDTSFSLVIFLLFIGIYSFSTQKKWLLLFLSAYGLMSLAFLLKGLPAVAFLGLTLLVWLIYLGEWRRLFSWRHALGVGLCIALLGGFLALYSLRNDPLQLLKVFLLESSKATAVEQGTWSTIKHLFVFPFDLIYHFLPWTLFVVFMARKSCVSLLREHSFLTFCGFVFMANIWVYWISPRVFPRYLFMFLPLMFYVFFYCYENGTTRLKKAAEWIHAGILVIISFALPFALTSERVLAIDYAPWLLFGASFCLLLIVYFFYREQKYPLLWVACGLLVLRIVFNGLVIPARLTTEYASAELKPQTIETARKYKHKQLTIVGKENTYEKYSYYTNSFYLTSITGNVVERTNRNNLSADQLYIIDTEMDDLNSFEVIDSFPIRHYRRMLYIGRKK